MAGVSEDAPHDRGGQFPNGLTEEECAEVVEALEKVGFVKTAGGKLEYPSRATEARGDDLRQGSALSTPAP